MIANVKRILFIIVLLAVTAFGISAAKLPATAEIDSTNLLMGKLTRLKISLEKPTDGTKINFPLIENKDRKFYGLVGDSVELSQLKIDTTATGGRQYVNYNFMVQAFDSGRYELPPFELIVGADTAVTNSLSLNVIPVKVKADDQIDPFSDVVEPFEVTLADGQNKEQTFWEKVLDFWWLIALILLFIGVMIYGWIRYRKTGSFLPVRKPLPPYDQAVMAMRRLKERQLWESGKDKEYYTDLTDILRVYLEKQFGVNAKEMTSRQIMKALKKNNTLRPSREIVRPVLELADIVKFAKQKPLADENVMSFNRIMQFLQQTKPIEEPEDPKQKGGKK